MVKGGDGEATPIGVASALVTTGTVWCTRAGRGGMSGILLSSYVKRFTAIGGGGNYTALFIAAAVFALFGALSIQPVKGVR